MRLELLFKNELQLLELDSSQLPPQIHRDETDRAQLPAPLQWTWRNCRHHCDGHGAIVGTTVMDRAQLSA
uniref:Uncharacterized protein n=1 Tax=Ascaris lumbricoides TaxID=6252 RepID=A0A0M3IQ81_ASCLU